MLLKVAIEDNSAYSLSINKSVTATAGDFSLFYVVRSDGQKTISCVAVATKAALETVNSETVECPLSAFLEHRCVSLKINSISRGTP